ncbi:MAG TPA: hypothetical protein PLN40_15575, partial [Agitococcus sp.]|nr:hypothetical protein [Agitococcus sp.]
LGPEKLPHAARMAGAWLGRIRRTVIDIQAEIEKEVSAAELKQRMNDEIARLKAATNPIEEEIKAVENTIHQQMTDASQTVDAAPAYLAQQTPSINNDEPQENNSVPTAPSLPPSKVNLIKS